MWLICGSAAMLMEVIEVRICEVELQDVVGLRW